MGLPYSKPSESNDPWFNPELRTRNYNEFGDAYRDFEYHQLTEKWNLEPGPNQPYLAYVKQASMHWNHLKLLADFMQIGSHPQQWKNLDPNPQGQHLTEAIRQKRIQDRSDRMKKTKVCVLDYAKESDKVSAHHVAFIEALNEYLEEEIDESIRFRLYVVNDLSRDVIEALGHKLAIEPAFFRAHIVDYAWYNVRDRWRDPPDLDVVRRRQVGRRQNWIQARYVTARYFDTTEEFKAAANEAKKFNVLRRPDDDLSNQAWWDEKGAIVGLTRSRATFWLQSNHTQRPTAVGVLLLDPTVDRGVPIWRGYRNWYPPEPGAEPVDWPKIPPQPNNIYDDFLYWAQLPKVFSTPSNGPASTVHVPIQALLHIVGSEWLTMSDYIKTRLNQIEMEIVRPKDFAQDFAPGNHIDSALERLHVWRRLVPLYREMVSETLQQIFSFPSHTETFPSAIVLGNMLHHNPVAIHESVCHETYLERQSARHQQAPSNEATATSITNHGCMQRPSSGVTSGSSGDTFTADNPSSTAGGLNRVGNQQPQLGSITAYRNDFLLVLSYLEEHQKRIDRLTSVVTAVMGIIDTRRSVRDARNIGRLTWLATFFIPFSLIATMFCMQTNIPDLYPKSIRLYFEVSIPLGVLTVVVAWVLSHPSVQNAVHDRWVKTHKVFHATWAPVKKSVEIRWASAKKSVRTKTVKAVEALIGP